ncbi:preprotein translocase subunit SecA [Geobacter sulfurreducens]|jgi:preprotein translocase subunit SecA|uniref:Protein translocase subunit SecA n=1 Tax=Geobacter sulfurreducens (strain ATCC 51573 / DSM 12127 / PCA) TaxID=243231 RepID=SECA_GEOSL|nr:preprotein translocase subunit SecA [Geobacter sulfurreducens]Q74BJ1.1 RecName: Full=Protein translocase subunit SecA [Geobacter sulfurreducens PCA]AAR35426.1 preprotein translocase, SecA subunit [Geobacter sulfurreducens PCA]ADI84884.1 preprotein translocase, SecA subunit [Geobacter sulfurreducens KN400]AJY68278.1 preprotein translocase subunit SecA [Geobacter sulfurreducens]QVW33991.1 preprotein translocase subunit SecA [Geobacter sulfurreducens]UAC02780.1 preprotein translocase subunit 
MFGAIIKKIVGSKNERELKRMWPVVEKINGLESQVAGLTDDQLREKTFEFKERIARGESLESLLPEAFAVCREGGKRALGMRHFDVQLIGGMVLHQGKIAEMKTGEGKTLVATLPAYLNALTGRGVHVVTVNDYLARRDSEWMGRLYRFLGLTVGVIVHGIDDDERRAAYAADITYGTNNEFGFDYLRDNMKFALEDYVQRPFFFSIVDEVDSILIDEARTPLIISGPTEDSTDKYYIIDRIIPHLKKGEVKEVEANTLSGKRKVYTGDFTVDEKARSSSLTEEGVAKVEKLLKIDNLYDPRHMEILHHVNQALRAHALFRRDVDYVVKDGEVIIVDEFTGRLMPGRRWSDGLHQAIEAKEGVEIENENQTLATITFQNYFRMYEKLSGMTGTADTEAEEFHKIYKLEVTVIPTNRPLLRPDFPDVIYKTEREKFNAVIEEIKGCHEKGQPTLVGTISIEKSEVLAEILRKQGIPHNVLNAKQHEREAEIVAQAGRKGMVTIATNMAGRGTDILLGGNPEGLAKQWRRANPDAPEEEYEKVLAEYRTLCAREHDEVVALGGLHIIGTERHESRRIDNQLRGRSGRQGDPGSSRFYLSLEDDLLRIFGSERVSKIMDFLKIEEGEAITHGMITKAIENAQKKVEAHNFEIRKHLIEYDDVMNKQREVIYTQRREILAGQDIRRHFTQMMDDTIEEISSFAIEKVSAHEWDWQSIGEGILKTYGFQIDIPPQTMDRLSPESFRTLLKEKVHEAFDAKVAAFGDELMDHLIKVIMLQTIDAQWKDHLLSIDHLKEGIGLRGYGQKDPKQEYKKEAYQLFMDMMARIAAETVEKIFWVQIAHEEDVERMEEEQQKQARKKMVFNLVDEDETSEPSKSKKLAGRNEPCPCGSGKKYKKCCGK